jgi:Mn-dependent DtxR family transcriptional regulator
MDAETAIHMLKISKNELNNMIRKLSQMEMLQYVDYNTIELTDVGIGYLSKKRKK